MKTISVSEAKATLSAQIRRVKSGEDVLITDRGRPVARLSAPTGTNPDELLDTLEREGLLRRGSGPLPNQFFEMSRPADPDATLRAVLQDERSTGW